MTIFQVMTSVTIVGCVSGLLVRNREQFGLISDILLGLLLFVGPSLVALHFAIEANRRDAPES